MNWLQTALLLKLIFLSSLSQGYEVDNFTMRYKPLAAADEILDKKVNEAFDKVVEKANEDNIGCSKSPAEDKRTMDGHRKFRGLLREAVAPGNVVGVFEDLVDGNGSWLSSLLMGVKTKVPKHSVNLENSIYATSSQKKIILSAAGINSSIKLGGEYIGADKLGHFFDQGYQYFHRWTLNGSELGVYRLGKGSEESSFGKSTTGILSYGDLAANYSGFQFWRSVTDGANPYFRCENGKWSKVRSFSWADHVNPGWDEAINCSSYATSELTNAVARSTKELELKDKKKFTCPVDELACAKLAAAPNAKHYISPECLKFKNAYDLKPSPSRAGKGVR